MANNRLLAKNTIFLYVRMLLIMAVSLYTSRVVLATLGFKNYGIYDVIGGVVAIFGFLNGAMSGASARFLSFELGRKDYRKLSEVFSVLVVSHLGIAICVLILCETVGLWLVLDKLTLPESQMNIALWVFQISIVSSLLSITLVPYTAILISYENMKIYAYIGIAEALLKLGVVFLLIIIPGNKLLIYSILLLAVQLFLNVFYRVYCTRNYQCCHFRLYKNMKLYSEIFGFVGGDLIGNISVIAQGQGLNILLNIFFGPVVNAARGITFQVQGAVQQFSNNFITAMRPQIIKLYAENKISEMIRLVERGSCFSFYLLWILILPIYFNMSYILHLWLGKYPDYTEQFLSIVLAITLVNALKSPRSMVFHATGKVKFVNMVIGTMLIMTFPLSYVILRFGGSPVSVFVISLIMILLTEFVSVFILKRYVTFSARRYLMTVHLRCLCVAVLSLVMPYWCHQRLPDESFPAFLINVTVSFLSVAIVVLSVGMDKNMRTFVLELIKRKIIN